jgi:membrane-associated phospholipid phosphatase
MVTNGLITVGMKRAFGRERPNGSCCESFPSGHTSHSFTMASIANELYGKNIGFVTYGLATLVAVSRMNDNKHYLSDVIFGAALGTVVGQSFAKNFKKIEERDVQIGLTSRMTLKISIPVY